MRFRSLGSGSTGNATLVEARSGSNATRVLLDCGFSLRELEARLLREDLVPADLSAVFITHEHGDHVGCALTLARKHRVPLWMSRGTWRALGAPDLPEQIHFARDGALIDVGNLQLQPYTVPHDALEPLQICFTDGQTRLGVLTDAGMATEHLLAHLQNCHALLLECNHDSNMLAHSRYPESLKRRIAGRLGHLSNDTSARILAACVHAGLRDVVAAHLSEQNNSPELALGALAEPAAAYGVALQAADAVSGFDWLEVRA
jgi:phosphoribosyl 1,2-cyclic phosphodiesterase